MSQLYDLGEPEGRSKGSKRFGALVYIGICLFMAQWAWSEWKLKPGDPLKPAGLLLCAAAAIFMSVKLIRETAQAHALDGKPLRPGPGLKTSREELEQFENLQVLYRWRYTPEEWEEFSKALKPSFPWRRSAMLGMFLPAVLTSLKLFAHSTRAAHPSPATEMGLFIFFALLIIPLAAFGYWARYFGNMHPRPGDTPVGSVTSEGVRVGDQIFWFNSKTRRLLSFEVGNYTLIGRALVFATRWEILTHPVEVHIIVPFPRAQPGLADTIAHALALELGVSATPNA